MKKLLVLAGGSKRNEAWGEACVEYFKDRFASVDFIRYNHWQTGEPNIDFAAEIEKIKSTVANTGRGEWYVLAKSIGSILALKAVEAGAITPTKCVFFGMPFSVVAGSEIVGDWSLLSGFSVPAFAFHNDDDPTANYQFTKEKLTEYAPTIILKTLSGDTHDYFDFAYYDEDVKNFLKI